MTKKDLIYKTYLVYGKNISERKSLIKKLIPENFKLENNPDFLHLQMSDKKKSIGIDEVKVVGQFLQTKPISHRVKIALISDSNSLTIEAQNSLLKILEEHSDNSIMILEDSNINFLLPTIISRCILERVISDDLNKSVIPENFFELNETEKLNFMETINKLEKEEIINILNSSLKLLRDENGHSKYQAKKTENLKNINLISKTCENLEKYNLNTRLALENLALNLITIVI